MSPIALCSFIERTESSKPDTKQHNDVTDASLTFLSTKLPPKAADMPKKNIANEKANSIADTEHPISEAISPFSRLQQ
jgi:hypothetical protein